MPSNCTYPGITTAARPRTDCGFTILELLAVLSILTILMGVGFGFLQRGSTDLDLAESIVRDQVRLCSVTAREQSLPTELLVSPASGGSRVGLQARVLRPVGEWHFEADERWIDERLRPDLAGDPEPNGRFGRAWRPPTDATMLAVRTGAADAFYLEDGFALRLDLRLDQRQAMTVASWGRAFELRLDADLLPQARLTLSEPGPKPGLVATISAPRPLALGQWITLELVHDGRVLRLVVDGRELARTGARGSVFQAAGDVFEISPSNAPIVGVVDEVRLLAYEKGDLIELPNDVELSGVQGSIDFDSLGMPQGHPQLVLKLQDQSVKRTVGPGGVLE